MKHTVYRDYYNYRAMHPKSSVKEFSLYQTRMLGSATSMIHHGDSFSSKFIIYCGKFLFFFTGKLA